MKKSITLFIAFCICLTNTLRADVDPGIKRTAADIGGMLASIELGPLSPLIGACCTIAAMTASGPGGGGSLDPFNHKNTFDNVGSIHNKVIFDYFKSNKEFSVEKYYSFIEKNGKHYGVSKLPPKKVFEDITREFGNPENDLWGKISRMLSKEGLESNIVPRVIEVLQKSKSYKDAVANVTRLENSDLSSNHLNRKQLETLSSFYSMLRYTLVFTFSK